jgi:hypothetical protein
MTKFLDLPPEVLCTVFRYVEHKDELARLSLLSKDFGKAVQCCLFGSFSHGWQNGPRTRDDEDIAVSKIKRLQHFCHTLLARPDLALCVREFEIAEVYHESTPTMYLDAKLLSAINSIDLFRAVPRKSFFTDFEDVLLALLLTRLRNVEVLRIAGNKSTPYLTMALYSIFRNPSIVMPHLRKVDLISWYPWDSSPKSFPDWNFDHDSPVISSREWLKNRSGLFDPLIFPFPTPYEESASFGSGITDGKISINLAGVSLNATSLVQLREPGCLQALHIYWPHLTPWDPQDFLLTLRPQTHSLHSVTIFHPPQELRWPPQYAQPDPQFTDTLIQSYPVSRQHSEDYNGSEASWDKTELRTMCLHDDFSDLNKSDRNASTDWLRLPPQMNLRNFSNLQLLTLSSAALFGPVPASSHVQLRELLPSALQYLHILNFHDSQTVSIINLVRHNFSAIPNLTHLHLTASCKSENLALIHSMSRLPRWPPSLSLRTFIGPSPPSAVSWNPDSDPYIPPKPRTEPPRLRIGPAYSYSEKPRRQNDDVFPDDSWVLVSFKTEPKSKSRISPPEVAICWNWHEHDFKSIGSAKDGCGCSCEAEDKWRHEIGVWPEDLPES